MHNHKMRRFSGMIGLLILLLFGVLSLTAYGEEGDGTGSAQGAFKPLGLISATLEDGSSIIGAVNVPLKPKVAMHFDKNVVYLVYWEKNKKCFHLYDNNKRELALEISKIDDTVDFTKRQYIWVEPVQELAPGTEYRLYVAPDLLAKNGGSTLAMTTNNQGITIKFQTVEQKMDSPAADTMVIDSEQKSSVDGNQEISVAAAGAEPVAPLAAADSVPDPSAEPANDPGQGQNPVSSKVPGNLSTSGKSETGLSGNPPAADKTNEIDYKAQQNGQKIQKYVAGAAVFLLLAWVIYEGLRIKRKKDMAR